LPPKDKEETVIYKVFNQQKQIKSHTRIVTQQCISSQEKHNISNTKDKSEKTYVYFKLQKPNRTEPSRTEPNQTSQTEPNDNVM
jgi:hypothetical protein